MGGRVDAVAHTELNSYHSQISGRTIGGSIYASD
jgi:hypothetical protein